MGSSTSKLRRLQLDNFFGALKSLRLSRPKKGWIYEIRNALGMSMSDLASRMGTIKQRVDRIEKDEIKGKVTIETMEKTAEALGCEFVYFMVPKQSLQDVIEKRAEELAREMVLGTNNSMKLESQAIDKKTVEILIEEFKTRYLIAEKNLWRK